MRILSDAYKEIRSAAGVEDTKFDFIAPDTLCPQNPIPSLSPKMQQKFRLRHYNFTVSICPFYCMIFLNVMSWELKTQFCFDELCCVR